LIVCSWNRPSSPAHLLLFVRFPQCRLEATFAHSARLAALASDEAVTAGSAFKILLSRSIRFKIGVSWESLRPATDALLAEDLLALHTDSGHERP
jgi:hypothetical protein